MELAKKTIINGRYRIERLHPSPDPLVRYYVARDVLLERFVMIKLVRDKDNEAYLSRFVLEAQVMAVLEHPHIVPIYDYGFYEDHPFQVQRYFSGGSFDDALQQHPKGMAAMGVLNFAQQIGSALQYIHRRGIVHRNLEPKNIILDEQMQPYLTNFALAAQHASPDTKSIISSKTTDLYEFGLLLYRAFTGKQPEFEYHRIKDSVRHYRPDLPIGVDLVIDRLTRKQESERYKSAVQAINALYQAFYSGQGSITGQIFISYGRNDKEYVYTLAKELRRIGLDIWIDLDIPAGTNWDKAIEDALEASDKMLLIVSPASMISENVQDEWSYFLEQGKSVYPYIYQESDMSFRLRRRQFITSTGDFLTDVAHIVDVLAGGTAQLAEDAHD